MANRLRALMPSESQIQSAFIEWIRWSAHEAPELTCGYSIPNGANTTPQNRRRLVREGLQAGMPDWCLPVARNEAHSLYIEFKTPKGRLSPEQKEMRMILIALGHDVIVSSNWEDAARYVCKYLGREDLFAAQSGKSTRIN